MSEILSQTDLVLAEAAEAERLKQEHLVWVATERRKQHIAEVGEHTVFAESGVRIGDWHELPSDWPTLPHIVRGPELFCGPSLIALVFEDSNGKIYFPIPQLVANLLGAALTKGRRLAQAEIKRAIGVR